eukprot:GFKZ01014256.1.p1 GENE.GFKZ01014256.1~~GFKZ01014256.1.p1  ORF type:complete len:346 (-),score=36.13 GFKZ01014256.1:548-1585(-)
MADATDLRPVCVTGATGYIASFIIRELLDQNHAVRGTVRSLSASSKLAPLRAMDPTGCKLELVEMDLLDSSKFPSVISGCKALIHAATPVAHCSNGWSFMKTEEEARELQIKPAVEGTEGLLRAAAGAGVKKVVLLSSNATMVFKMPPYPVLDESCWSDVELLRKNIVDPVFGAYPLAKTLQEKLAWQLAGELDLDVVCINPTFVTGPSLTPHANAFQLMLMDLCRGVPQCYAPCRAGTVPDLYVSIVDVREVARAHVLALGEAKGRYLLLTADIHYEDVLKLVHDVDSRFRVKDFKVDSEDGTRRAMPNRFDNSRARNLGVCTIPWEDTIREAALSLIQHGHQN